MRLTVSLLVASLSATAARAEVYDYACSACLYPSITVNGNDGCDVVNGKTYPLRVDNKKNVLEWRGRKYRLTEQPSCANYGWHADAGGASFDFCTATQGYGAIQDKGNTRVRCSLGK